MKIVFFDHLIGSDLLKHFSSHMVRKGDDRKDLAIVITGTGLKLIEVIK
jgi:hypothetical protein